MIFDNEDDIFIFSKNVWKFEASRENKFEAKYQSNSLKNIMKYIRMHRIEFDVDLSFIFINNK